MLGEAHILKNVQSGEEFEYEKLQVVVWKEPE